MEHQSITVHNAHAHVFTIMGDLRVSMGGGRKLENPKGTERGGEYAHRKCTHSKLGSVDTRSIAATLYISLKNAA